MARIEKIKIVQEEEIITVEDIKLIKFTDFTLEKIWNDSAIVENMARLGLIQNSVTCINCNLPMNYLKDKKKLMVEFGSVRYAKSLLLYDIILFLKTTESQ